jgi:hypothetical protein
MESILPWLRTNGTELFQRVHLQRQVGPKSRVRGGGCIMSGHGRFGPGVLFGGRSLGRSARAVSSHPLLMSVYLMECANIRLLDFPKPELCCCSSVRQCSKERGGGSQEGQLNILFPSILPINVSVVHF